MAGTKRRTSEEVARSNAATAKYRLEQAVTEARLAAFQKSQKESAHGGGGGGARMAVGSYSTQRDRMRNPRAPQGGSANFHLDVTSLRDLRRDSQQALRTDRVARGLFKGLVRLTIGDGPSLVPMTADKDWNTKKKALWAAWIGNDYQEAVRLGYTGTRTAWTCETSGLSTLLGMIEDAMKSAITDGAIGVGLTATDERGGGGKLAFYEAERFTGPKGQYAQPDWIKGKGGWIGGVELDGDGLALRAGIAPWGMTQGQPANGGGGNDLEYLSLIDGSGMLFRNPMDHSTNQVMGEPALAAVLPGLDHLDEYDKSVREAARNHAALVGVITSPSPGVLSGGLVGSTEDLSGTVANASSSAASTQEQRRIVPGQWFDAGMGTKVDFSNPTQPGAQYREFKAQQASEIGADIGSSPIVATMDGANSNYSGFRAALALNFRISDRWREEFNRLLRFIEVFKTAQWIRAGMLDLVEDWSIPSHFVWPPMPQLDPIKEISAANAAVAGGLKSRSEAILEISGRSLEDVENEREIERKGEIRRGLDKPNMIGQGPPVPHDPVDGADSTDTTDTTDTKVGGRFGSHVNGTSNGTGKH